MLTKLRRMLDIEDDNLPGSVIHRIIDEVGVFAGRQLAHALRLLDATSIWKKYDVLQTL